MLDLLPARFDRIQLRRMCGKIFKLEPFRMFFPKIRFRRMMARKMIPDDHDFPPIVMMNLRQEENEVLEPRRPLEDRETEVEKMTPRRPCNVTDAGVVVSPRRLAKNRRLPDGRPSVNTIRHKGETALVP